MYPVQEVSAESQALMARALEEAEQEMRCKAELIQQIRAMERAPLIRTKFVDLTETGKQGLLVEMSVAEVRRVDSRNEESAMKCLSQ